MFTASSAALDFSLTELWNQSAHGVLITDEFVRIRYVNPSACRITGYAEEELLGRNPRLLQSGETSGETYRDLWSRLRRGETWQGVVKNKRPDGTVYRERLSISPLRSERGKVTHYIGLIEDITEEYRLHESLRQKTLLLQRTYWLQDFRLFVNNVAGSINNLLTALIGNAELGLANVEDPDEIRHRLRRILSSTKQGAAFSAELQELSGIRPVNREIVPFDELLSEQARKLRDDTFADLIELKIYDGDFDVFADPEQLKAVIRELIKNATEAVAGRESAGAIRISLDLEDNADEFEDNEDSIVIGVHPRHAIAFEIADDGCGIPAESRERIFDPCYTTKRFSRGLGLPFVLAAVLQNGGQIRVLSAADEGTRVTVLLPAFDKRLRH